MTTEQGTPQWCKGGVGSFAKLHYKTFKCVGEFRRRLRDRMETVKRFCIEGKYRPCLILQVQDDYYRVWCATTQRKDSCIPLKDVQGLDGDGFLTLDPTEIYWIHKRLRGNWIGPQHELSFVGVIDE